MFYYKAYYTVEIIRLVVASHVNMHVNEAANALIMYKTEVPATLTLKLYIASVFVIKDVKHKGLN